MRWENSFPNFRERELEANIPGNDWEREFPLTPAPTQTHPFPTPLNSSLFGTGVSLLVSGEGGQRCPGFIWQLTNRPFPLEKTFDFLEHFDALEIQP